MTVFSNEEALEASTKYFNNDDLAADVFIEKYALRDNNQNLLEKTPADMHKRLAAEFARIELEKYSGRSLIRETDEIEDKFKYALDEKLIYSLFDKFKYLIPQGSPMYGIGNDYTYQSLGNCFTLGEHPYDSYGGICYADQMLVQLSKRRCGVGLSLDKIRPKGLTTKNAARTTDGIGVFMQRFSNSTREVAQSGRRGALLQGLSVHHPEIETFINIKKDLKKVTGANISVVLTDDFMTAVKKDKEYEQRWPIEGKSQISKKVKARYIWDQIIDAAWSSAEPGLLFIDKAREYGLSHQYGIKDERFKDIITNPCGEIWIGLDSCRLFLINLFNYVVNPFKKDSYFDYALFNQHCIIAQRLMDDMVDLEIEKMNKIIEKVKSDPEPEHIKNLEIKMWENYKEVAELGRRTGLGITALGDTLAAMGIKYGSNESIRVTEDIYRELAIHSMKSSCLMAELLGSFKLYDKELEKNHPFLDNLFKTSSEVKELHNKFGRRNVSLTTTAPAGSVSTLTQTTSGIEPVYLLQYKRRRKISNDAKKYDFIDASGDKWEEYIVNHHHLKTWMDTTGETDIEKSPYWKATSNDIDWEKSVDMQAAAQKWITHSISKTCNIPKDSTKELVSDIYMKAWEKGCKGFTIYRDGCRDGVLISMNDKKEDIIQYNDAPKRPKELDADVFHFMKGGKPYFVLVGLLDGKFPYEVFAGKDDNSTIHKSVKKCKIIKRSSGKYKAILDDDSELSPISAFVDHSEESLTRLISTSMRHGVKLEFIISQLEKDKSGLNSLAKIIGKALKYYCDKEIDIKEECPECRAKILHLEGCKKCSSCSYVACG